MDSMSERGCYYFMESLIDDTILGIIVQDASWCLLSMSFIFLWIWYSTGSWFLAIVGFGEIFFAITVSWFICAKGFGTNYFPPQNALAFFIVAAIGADGTQQEVLLCTIVLLS